MSDNIDQTVARIATKANVDESVVRDRLTTLTDEFSVPLDSATASIEADFGVGESNSAARDDGELTTIPELEGENWGALKIRVRELWDNSTDNISQVCLVEDEAGNTAKLTVFDGDFSDDAEPQFEPDAVYVLRDAVGDFYNGRAGIRIPNTTVEQVDSANFDSGVSLTGVVVALQDGSGLVKRCPHDGCTRVLRNGQCAEHGAVNGGQFDIRLKLVVSTGAQDIEVVITDNDRVEALTGIGLADATDIAKDALDTAAVAREMADAVLGTVVRVDGTVVNRRVLPDTIEIGTDDVAVDEFNATVPIQTDGYTRHASVPSVPSELVHVSDVAKASDEDQAPIMATLPDDSQANRVLTVGTVTTVRDVSNSDTDAYLQAAVTDRHGSTVNVYAGRYQSDARDQIDMLSTPAHVLVVGKPDTWVDDDGGIHFKLTAETVLSVPKQTRELVEAVAARRGAERLDADEMADSYTDDQREAIADALAAIRIDNPVAEPDGDAVPAPADD